MSNIHLVARQWQTAGVSVIPILPDGTKKPAVRWAEYQSQAAELGQVDQWWGNGRLFGLAVICGQVSGNLEMLELEGRAMREDAYTRIRTAAENLGLAGEWDQFLDSVYTEESPYGGVHFIYRVCDQPVPGNEKIARRPATIEELAENPAEKVKVLAETRGEGGYVIVAPTPGICHPSGNGWTTLYGDPGEIAEIPWTVRQAVHAVIRAALDEVPPVAASLAPAPPSSPGIQAGAGSRPGDDWANQHRWSDILERDGWTFSHTQGVEEYWVRPGKSRRDGHSATTNYGGSDLLKVFSSSVEYLEPEATYTKFGYMAAVHFGGDHAVASQALARQGFGTPMRTTDSLEQATIGQELAVRQPENVYYTLDDMGSSQRLWDRVQGRFHWVGELGEYHYWNGKHWGQDMVQAHLDQEFIRITEEMLRSEDEAERKQATRCRQDKAVTAVLRRMRGIPGVTVSATSFDRGKNLLNLQNGILDLETHTLMPHDPKHMITRIFGASYNPQAQAPHFRKFIESALPDAEMRGYVQRALGQTLLGNAAERSMFVIYGPSGTGKSTLLETIQKVFGDYAVTAPGSTFRSKWKEAGASYDVHRLKGKRFVISSETSEMTQFDEELLKRITGHDTISSRNLYQQFTEWVPECTVWLATNHKPTFNSDDNAIWNRLKLVEFATEFIGEGEVRNFAVDYLIPEADGILNWLLEGLRDYQAQGLSAPAAVAVAAENLRQDTDAVARFLEDKVADGVLVYGPDQKVRSSILREMYIAWARQTGERVLGSRRFANRMASLREPLSSQKFGGQQHWVGVGVHPGAGVIGTM